MTTLSAVARPPAIDEPPLHVATITELAQAMQMREIWLLLEQRQHRAVFFQSFAWCTHVWRSRLALALPGTPAPHVLVVRRGGRFVAIWPLAISSGAAGRYAQDLTEPFGQYADILIDPAEDCAAVCRAALRAIAGWHVDGLLLRKVRDDSPLRLWLQAHGTLAGGVEAAPEVAIAAAGGYDAYRSSLNAKTRKNLRNMRNRLSREGAIVHTLHDRGEDAASIVARCFEGRTGWLESSGLSSTAFADPAFEGVIRSLTGGSAGAPLVVALRLALTDAAGSGAQTELSLHWGFEHGGRYYAYMASRNAAFDAFSPGRLHLESVIEALAVRGIETIDLLMPAIPYKTSVATGTVAVATYGVSFSMRGKLAIDGWHGYVRPALKKAMLALPPAARRGIMGVRSAIGAASTSGASRPPPAAPSAHRSA